MSILKNLLGLAVKSDDEGAKMEKPRKDKSPFYLKATLILVGLYLFFYILYILQDALTPLCFALLIAILLNPLVNKLMNWKVPKVLAILLAILLAIIVIGGIVTFISAELAQFSDLAPEFKQRGTELLNTVQSWIRDTFHVPLARQNTMLHEGLQSSQKYVGKTLGTIFSVLGVVVLLPIYTFLILYYKPLFLNFFYEVFDDKHEDKVADVLNQTKSAVQSYIVGLLIETSIVAVLNSVALLLIGVKYAVLLGVIGALLNLIPYIGGVIAIAMPVVMALITCNSGMLQPALIIGSYALIQFIDNNLLVPRIVSSKVDVNAFVTIIIVLLGGTLWGVAGMFLAVPFIAVCKIIFDRIPSLKPWGKLLGVKIEPTSVPEKIVSEQDREAMDEESK